MAPIEGERVLGRQRAHLVLPADDRHAIGMRQILRRGDLLAQQRAGFVVDTRAPLLDDHVALGQHHLVAQHQVGHAVGLERHDQPEPLLGDLLVVAGVVLAGEGVFVAAVARDQAREFAVGIAWRALEHEMLEEMRDARLADRIVGRADAVPHHVHHDRRAMVRHDHDLHAVLEREGLGIEDRGARAGRCQQDQHERGEQPAERRRCHRVSSTAAWVVRTGEPSVIPSPRGITSS